MKVLTPKEARAAGYSKLVRQRRSPIMIALDKLKVGGALIIGTEEWKIKTPPQVLIPANFRAGRDGNKRFTTAKLNGTSNMDGWVVVREPDWKPKAKNG